MNVAAPVVSSQPRPGSDALLSLEDARALILEGVRPLPVEVVALSDALGRVLAEPLESRLMLPPWDNSAMDGFAVRGTDVAAASASRPIVLPVRGEAAAGRAWAGTVEPGTAVRILTGAPVPAGADAIVPVEDTDAEPGVASLPETVAINAPAHPGRHVRRAGSDLQPGYPLLDAGVELTPAALAVAAAGGHGALKVHRRPRVAVIATGDELAPPGAALGPAQIPDSNSVGLVAQARELGAEARALGIAGDEADDVMRLLRDSVAWADVVVASGGVSVGAHDVVRDCFARIGRLTLWRVAVQPGKPLAVARAPRGDGNEAGGEVLLFGLPGNPVSSFVTFELFVRPVLRRLAGHADLDGRDVVRARLAEPVTKATGRRAFLRVRLEHVPAESPAWRARLAGGQSSHVLSALAAADGLAVVREEYEGLPEGSEIDVIRLTSANASSGSG